MTIDKNKWQELIQGIEQLIREADDVNRKEELRRSIRLFKRMMEHGEPWPGTRRKQNTKKLDRSDEC